MLDNDRLLNAGIEQIASGHHPTPGFWLEFLSSFTLLTDSFGCCLLFRTHRSVKRWASSKALGLILESWNTGRWTAFNELLNGLEDAFDEFVYNDFAISTSIDEKLSSGIKITRAESLRVAAALRVSTASGEYTFLVFQPLKVTKKHGELNNNCRSIANALVHLIRESSTRVRNKPIALVSGFTSVGVPAMVLSSDNLIVARNNLDESIQSCLDVTDDLRLTFRNEISNSRYLQLVRSPQAAGGTFALLDKNGRPTGVGTLSQVLTRPYDVFQRAAFLLIFSKIEAPAAPNVELLADLYNLSPAEARMAKKLVESSTIDQIAAETNVSKETLRTQLKRVMEKVGARRQADLVGVIAGNRFPKAQQLDYR